MDTSRSHRPYCLRKQALELPARCTALTTAIGDLVRAATTPEVHHGALGDC